MLELSKVSCEDLASFSEQESRRPGHFGSENYKQIKTVNQHNLLQLENGIYWSRLSSNLDSHREHM